LEEKVAAPAEKTEIAAVGIRNADHVAICISKSWTSFARTSGGRLAGIVRSPTQTTEFVFVLLFLTPRVHSGYFPDQ
jgi:hypothetical protein